VYRSESRNEVDCQNETMSSNEKFVLSLVPHMVLFLVWLFCLFCQDLWKRTERDTAFLGQLARHSGAQNKFLEYWNKEGKKMGIKLAIELARSQDRSRKQGEKEGKECENEGADNEDKIWVSMVYINSPGDGHRINLLNGLGNWHNLVGLMRISGSNYQNMNL
jgi:hypothetical protein